MNRVLVLGVYLYKEPSLAREMSDEIGRSKHWEVTQLWGATCEPNKFEVFNTAWQQAQDGEFDYVLCCDDDVRLPPGFLDAYLSLVEAFDLALAQPARSLKSTGSHPITFQHPGTARVTRFVEGGPVFSIRVDAQPLLLPFDCSVSGMCAGREFVWSYLMEQHRLRQGIVDGIVVHHNFRRDGTSYDRKITQAQTTTYMNAHAHELLAPEKAMTVVEAW